MRFVPGLYLILLLAGSHSLLAQGAAPATDLHSQSTGIPAGSVTMLADQRAAELEVFIVELPEFSFSDTDTITYTPLLNGAPLPLWIDFTPKDRTFSGLPVLGCQGLHSVSITASNGVYAESYAFILQVDREYVIESQY
jgi:hypothetical protein